MSGNPRAVARASRAVGNGAPTGSVPGGFGGVPATMGTLGATQNPSPLISSYQQWSQGRPYGIGLPRDPGTFLAGAFGPLTPIEPVGIDAPDPDTGRPEPRRYTYQVGWNMPVGEPGSEGLKLAPFATLRSLADQYSVARACINVRKQEILGLEWDIMPTREAEKKMRGQASRHKDFQQRRAEAVAFFQNPDPGKYRGYSAWLSAVLEEIFVIDALTLYVQPTRKKGRGLLGSDLGALCLIDGTTARPLLDIQGGTPQPPNPAVQIYNYGVPRVDLMTAISGAEVSDMKDSLLAEYRADQVLYLPYTPRAWTPYGFSLVEKALVPIVSGLQRQQYQLSYFGDGSVPGVFIASGDPNATPNQLRTLQDALNAMAGDPAWKHKIIVLPGGSKIEPMRPVPLADAFDEVIMNQVCMAFDVMPMELGITPQVSLTPSPGAANQMAKASAVVNQRKALRPLLMWLKQTLFDYVLQTLCGQDDMQFMWAGLEEGQDRESLVGNLVDQVGHGMMSIDEARVEIGEQPWGLPLTSDPVWATQMGVVPLGSIDPLTGRPAAMQPLLPGQAGTPVTGSASAASGIPAPTPVGAVQTGNVVASVKEPTPAAAVMDAKDQARANQASGTPSHGQQNANTPVKPANVKGALRELDLIRRRLEKGRSIKGWAFADVPEHIGVSLIEDLEVIGPNAAINKARDRVKANVVDQRREQVIAPIAAQVASRLGTLARGVKDGSESRIAVIDDGTRVMREGIRQAILAGARDAIARPRAHATKADDGGENEDEDGGYDADTILDGPYGQYLTDLADQRAGDQTDFLTGLLQDILRAGAIDEILQALAWRFDLYGAQAYAAYNLGYGLTAFSGRPDGYVRWNTTSADPCVLCAPRDGQLYTADTIPGFPGDGGFGGTSVISASGLGLCMGGPRCRCTLTPVGDPGLLGALAFAPAASETNQPSWLTALINAARLAWIASLPDDQSNKAAQEITHEDHGNHKVPDQTHHVYAYLARHYPADQLEWVKRAVWHGPVNVPLDQIDMDRREGGARDPNKVAMIAHSIDDGHKLDPVVLVEEPGHEKYLIADGWHRTAAIKQTGGHAAPAYVGVLKDGGFSTAAMGRAKLNKFRNILKVDDE